jgi:tRNA(adenine34) deaminase
MLARVAPALLLLRPTPRWRSCSPLGCARREAEDARFMRLALAQASLAFQAGEIPIGSVLVRGGECIAAERNRVEELQDASAHAEMLCLRSGSAALHSWRLLGTTLYVTVEPCPMCLAASHAFRIDRLVYGTVNPRLGAVESSMAQHSHPNDEHPFHSFEISGGVLADEAGEIMKRFFERRRSGDAAVDKPPEGQLRREGDALRGGSRPSVERSR